MKEPRFTLGQKIEVYYSFIDGSRWVRATIAGRPKSCPQLWYFRRADREAAPVQECCAEKWLRPLSPLIQLAEIAD